MAVSDASVTFPGSPVEPAAEPGGESDHGQTFKRSRMTNQPPILRGHNGGRSVKEVEREMLGDLLAVANRYVSELDESSSWLPALRTIQAECRETLGRQRLQLVPRDQPRPRRADGAA